MLDSIKEFYKNAIQTTLLAQDNLTRKWFHIFSVIELQPEDIIGYNIPNDEWKKNTVRAKSSSKANSYSFYLTINKIATVEEALTIFNDPVANTKIDGNSIQFFNATSKFVTEPSSAFPLIFSSNLYSDDGLESILPKRHSGLYVWTKIDHLRVVQKLFETESVSQEMEAMSQLTNDWLGFDIWTKSEHIGNIYLSAPNPYFRNIDVSLSHHPVGIFYKINARKGINQKFNFRMIDKHGDAIALDKTVKVTDYIGLIELPHEPQLFQLMVYNEKQHLIALHKPASFIKSMHIDMHMKQTDLHVTVKSKETEDEKHIIGKYSKGTPLVIGTPADFNSAYYFKSAENKRKNIVQKNSKEYIFFPGAKTDLDRQHLKTEAKEIIREIIGQSKEACYLCDPYFNSKDLIEFAFYVKSSDVTVRVLNSKEFIKKEEAKNITAILKDYNSKPYGKIELHTLRGNSILHDRYLVADKNVWFIGSSFNEFGSRATSISKVPDSSNVEIIKEIEKWFFDANFSETIEDYANE